MGPIKSDIYSVCGREAEQVLKVHQDRLIGYFVDICSCSAAVVAVTLFEQLKICVDNGMDSLL